VSPYRNVFKIELFGTGVCGSDGNTEMSPKEKENHSREIVPNDFCVFHTIASIYQRKTDPKYHHTDF
jgi:hypothetical protein